MRQNSSASLADTLKQAVDLLDAGGSDLTVEDAVPFTIPCLPDFNWHSIRHWGGEGMTQYLMDGKAALFHIRDSDFQRIPTNTPLVFDNIRYGIRASPVVEISNEKLARVLVCVASPNA